MAARKTERGLIQFDVDGVFNRGTPKAYSEIFNLTIQFVDVDISDTEIEERMDLKWGSPSSDILMELLKENPELYPKARKFYKENITDIFAEYTSPVEGSAELLERLAPNYWLALNTAADAKTLYGMTLPGCGISPAMFSGGIYTADILESGLRPKPEADISRKIMEETRTPKARTWMVGDSDCDVHTAIYSEVEPIVTLTGNLNSQRAKEVGAMFIVEDVTRIEYVLEEGPKYRRSEGQLRSLGSMGLIQSPALL